jgi:2-keto-4-pentenoate hydratase/2-oxohepta-3-ene-1,7-dioic acid hydratase in catechol pathway
LFFKAPSAIVGPYDDIRLPQDGENVDWEIELGVVVGKRGRKVAAEHAAATIAGYLVTNDLSCRSLLWREDRQSIRSDWLASKSHDTFCPLGPYFVPRAFVPDHNDLTLRLMLNGEVMQDGNTAEMIFSPDEQIEYASKMMTLEPGDLFLTGTVAGVGQGRGRFLKAGDIVESEIPGLGGQRNLVV